MDRGPATLLIVDDLPSNIRVLQDLLRPHYRILFATDGPTALEVARTGRPDLILLDVMMPDMDGYEVCRRLKASPATGDIPVIFVTALGDERGETRGLELGAIDYLTKPVSPPVLLARVHNHLELKRRGDLLRALSMQDGLTGIANRRRFDAALAEEWRRARRGGRDLALLLFDIDHFKAYNDLYGHLAGDDCLRRVASALAGGLRRPGDLPARYGGEELAVLLPETGPAQALETAERLRAAVQALGLVHAGSPVVPVVTVSAGVAAWVPVDDAPERLIAAADQALYLAKSAGRNRAVAAAG